MTFSLKKRPEPYGSGRCTNGIAFTQTEKADKDYSDTQPAAQLADALAADGQHGVCTAHAQGKAAACPRKDAHDIAQVNETGFVDAVKVLLAQSAFIFAE